MQNRKLQNFKNVFRRKRIKNNKVKKSNFVSIGVTVLIFVLILSITTPILTTFYKFNTKTTFNTQEVKKWDYRSKFKVLLIGVDKKEGENIFVDGVSLLVVHPEKEEVGIINVNVDILALDEVTKKPIPFRRSIKKWVAI